jgi:nicotinamide phosphoribosyltransferase
MEFNFEGDYVMSFKKSKKGLLKLTKDFGGNYFTATSEDPLFDDYEDLLVEVFRDGKILKEYTFEEVRKNSGI